MAAHRKRLEEVVLSPSDLLSRVDSKSDYAFIPIRVYPRPTVEKTPDGMLYSEIEKWLIEVKKQRWTLKSTHIEIDGFSESPTGRTVFVLSRS